VRKTAGIEFAGADATTSWLLAEVRTTAQPAWGFRQDALGTHAIGKAELREALTGIQGTDFGAHDPAWLSHRTRQAAKYRNGRVLLAGDAAHIHPPVGGQGLNLGVQDAVNLGWKLAAEMTALDIRHDLGNACCPERHPLLGRRMPDLDIMSDEGPGRVYALLHQASPVLLNFGTRGARDASGWLDRVPVVDVTYRGTWELPAIGTVPAPDSVLIRPDGHVAWVGDGTARGLTASLAQWFGPPSYAMCHPNQDTLETQEQ
jgi:3-(3-hydroxy-phenyl)propionate hydroxylase